MKAYTDLNQSKKLAKILPLESADMCWQQIYDENHMMSDYRVELIPYRLYSGIGLPCWSLAALLDIYPMIVGRDMGMYCCWQNSKNLHSRHYDNPIDACVEMITRLHEQKLL